MHTNRLPIRPLIILRVAVLTAMLWSASTAAAQAAVSLQRSAVEADGHPLTLWSKIPDRSTRVVLLLHGRTWSARPDFDLQVPGEDLSLMDALHKQGYAVYGLDLRGYGATPRDSTGWLTPDRAAADIAIVLKWMVDRHPGLAKPVVFGWSYGCLSAQLCLQDHPDLASGLVFFGYPGRPYTPWPVTADPPNPSYWKNTAEAAVSDFIVPGSISKGAIDAYVKAALEADPVFVDWRRLDQWGRLDPRRVKTPMLLLQGQFDPVIDLYTHVDLFSRLGTANRQWVVIPGGDHAAFMETPRPLFLRVLFEFIDRIGAGP